MAATTTTITSLASLASLARRHLALLVVLAIGVAVRTAGSGPLPSSTPETQPIGYDLLLVTPGLGWTDNPQTLVLVQQLAALAGALACYALLARCGVSTWLAAAATLPVLLAPAALAGERLPVPDPVFAAVTAVALLVLCWRSRWPVPAAILGGALLGVAVTLRGVHEPLLLLAAVVFALAAGAWSGRALWAGAAVLGFAIPVVPLLTWAHNETGRYAVASSADAGHRALDASPSVLLFAGLALAAVVGLLAAAGARRAAASPARLTCLALVLVPGVVLVDGLGAGAPSAVDLLPALALWPAAAALGLTALLRGRRGQAASLPQIDDVDRAALAAFRERYGDPVLAPVVIVIAAYDEAAGIGPVLAALPRTACGLDVDVLVVDDASTDGTAAAAALDPRARVVACPVNRGQGAALRLGYRVARDHGATYIVTTDADGQYDPEEIPDLLAPVVAGTRRLRHRVAPARTPPLARPPATQRRLRVRLGGQRADWSAGHRHLVRDARDARRGDGGRHPEPAAVPEQRAADRRALARLPGRRGARHHAPAGQREHEEGPQHRLRLAIRPRGGRHLVARGLPPPVAGPAADRRQVPVQSDPGTMAAASTD